MLGCCEPCPGKRKQTPAFADRDPRVKTRFASPLPRAFAASCASRATSLRRYSKARRPTCSVKAASARFSLGFFLKCSARFWVAALSAAADRADVTRSCAGRGEGSEGRDGASSRITWAFVPPTPKALTPARRGTPFDFQSESSWFTRNGLFSRSNFGLGFWKCSVGG